MCYNKVPNGRQCMWEVQGARSDITELGLKSGSILCLDSRIRILRLAWLYLTVCWASCIVSVSTSKLNLVTTNCFVWWFLSETTRRVFFPNNWWHRRWTEERWTNQTLTWSTRLRVGLQDLWRQTKSRPARKIRWGQTYFIELSID